MAWENSIIVIAAMIAGGITSVLALVAFKRRFIPGAPQFNLLMLASAIWAFAYAFELGNRSISLKLFWVHIEYVGISLVPFAWLTFVLAYSGRQQWLKPVRVFWLGLPPVALILLSITNAYHHLVWDQVELLSSGPYRFLYIHHTFGFYAFVVYANILLVAGTVLVVRLALGAARFQRRQVQLVVVGTFIPWLGNILYVGNLNPVPGLDWTPFGFALSGMIFGLALFRYRLLDIIPIARHAILDSMREGVIVLDDRYRIVDCNPALERLSDTQAGEALGKLLEDCLPELDQYPDWLNQALQAELEVEIRRCEEEKLIELSATRLNSDGMEPIGYLILIRDITVSWHLERSRLESEERFRHLAEASLEGIIFSENGRIVDHNAQLAAMLGYMGTEQALIGRKVLDFIAPEEQERIQQLIQSEYAGSYTLHLLHRDGSLIPVEVRGKLIHMNDRTMRVSAVLDRSNQVRYQESLRRRDDILSAVSFVASALLKEPDWQTQIQEVLARLGRSAAASRAYLFQIDLNNKYPETYFNQRYEWVNRGISAQIDNPDLQGFSFTRAGFLDWESQLRQGKSISGLVKDFPKPVADFLRDENILALAIVPIFAFKQLWGFLGFDECDRERLWSEGEIEALEAAANTIGAAIQGQKIERSLRTSERRYRTLVDAAQDVIFTLTPRGRISSLNPAFEEITGWPAADWLGKSFLSVIDPADIAIAHAIVRQVLDGNSLPVFAASIKTRSGTPVIMEFKAVAERENGRINKIHGVARDITARVQTERSLQQRMEELAALYDTSLAINAQRELSSLLQAIVDRACRLIGASSGGIFLENASNQEVMLVVSHHLPKHYLGTTLENW